MRGFFERDHDKITELRSLVNIRPHADLRMDPPAVGETAPRSSRKQLPGHLWEASVFMGLQRGGCPVAAAGSIKMKDHSFNSKETQRMRAERRRRAESAGAPRPEPARRGEAGVTRARWRWQIQSK